MKSSTRNKIVDFYIWSGVAGLGIATVILLSTAAKAATVNEGAESDVDKALKLRTKRPLYY